MKSPSHDLALYLDSLGIGTFAGTVGWSINVSREPVAPVDAITIYDTGGLEADTDELDLMQPTFQVRVRSLNFPNAYAKHEAIRDALILPGRLVTADSAYVAVNMNTDIIDLGRDDNDRHILVANYRAIRERT